MTTETPSPEFLAKLKAEFKETQPVQEALTQPNLSTIDSALRLTDLEAELTHIDNNIFEYKRQSAIDFISITVDLTKAFLKSDYEKNPTVFKSSNLKDTTNATIKSAETIALAITSYTESTFRQRMENGLIPDAFKTRKADLQLQIETIIKTAKEDPALLRNIALAIKQGNSQLGNAAAGQVPPHVLKQMISEQNSQQVPRLKPLPNPELTKVIHSELERNKLSIVEKPLTNVAPLDFKTPHAIAAQVTHSSEPTTTDSKDSAHPNTSELPDLGGPTGPE